MKKVLKLNEVLIEINSNGKIFIQVKNNRPYKLYKNSSGYTYISVFNKGKRKNFLVHRLVATAFIENPDNKSQVNHKDENIENNAYSNLEWVTPYENYTYGNHRENVKQSSQKEFGITCEVILHSENDKIVTFNSIRDAAKYLNMSNGSLIGQIKKYKGTYKIKRKNITIRLTK